MMMARLAGRRRAGEGPPGDGGAHGAGRGFRRRDRRDSGARASRRGRGDRRAHRFVGRGTGRAGRWRVDHGVPAGAGADEEARAAAAADHAGGVLGERGERRARRRGVSRIGSAMRSRITWRPSRWTAAPRLRAGYGAGVDADSMEMLKQVGKLLERVGAGEITGGGGGSDIGPLMRDGVPGLGRAHGRARTTSTGTTPRRTRSTR